MSAPLLLTFYGDDFTGSSAVMEVLGFAGVPTMLFLDVPDQDMLDRYPDLGVVGVAGIARSKGPDWMRAHLPAVFRGLGRLGAPLVHYKVCSTFDSAPNIGSVGVAAEIGKQVFDPPWIPLVVGAPAIGRYQVFGTLFASNGAAVHRLDRHPVMARHPVTPMDEADLGRHLARQTDLRTAIIDFRALSAGEGNEALSGALASGAEIVAIDVMDDLTLTEAGRLLDSGAPRFAIGSQGVEYALVAHLRATGRISPDHSPPRLSPVDRLFAVSGSCSATTAAQIDHAEACGWTILEADAALAVDPSALAQETQRLRDLSLRHLSQGRDVLVSTARGPDDPSLSRMARAVAQAGIDGAEASARLGQALGTLVAEVRRTTGLPRAAIAGGDTSGQALSAVRAEALSAIAPLAPGAPLCRIHSSLDPDMDGLQVTLKGGQMGRPDFFIHARQGDA